jgi:hypothetical protein
MRDCLPNFFILGAAKAGTTSLYSYLKKHPKIFMAAEKEPHFFDSDHRFELGLEYYIRNYFKDAAGHPARGEATPSYLSCHAKVIPRILDVLDGHSLKFIVILRDPVKRAWSHYLHRRRNRTERESFEKALELEPSRLAAGEEWACYFRDGLYAVQIQVWIDAFSRDQFHIILNEDLKHKPVQVLMETFDFLEVDPSFRVQMAERRNRAAVAKYPLLMEFFAEPSILKYPFKLLMPFTLRRKIVARVRRGNLKYMDESLSLPVEMEENLRQKYLEDILQLEVLIGRSLSNWKPPERK